MKPDAPGLSSTTTACLVIRVTSWPSARASWSVALPAAKGTTKVIVLSGYCASASEAMHASAMPKTAFQRISVSFSAENSKR
jgi:hypothetical protein